MSFQELRGNNFALAKKICNDAFVHLVKLESVSNLPFRYYRWLSMAELDRIRQEENRKFRLFNRMNFGNNDGEDTEDREDRDERDEREEMEDMEEMGKMKFDEVSPFLKASEEGKRLFYTNIPLNLVDICMFLIEFNEMGLLFHNFIPDIYDYRVFRITGNPLIDVVNLFENRSAQFLEVLQPDPESQIFRLENYSF